MSKVDFEKQIFERKFFFGIFRFFLNFFYEVPQGGPWTYIVSNVTLITPKVTSITRYFTLKSRKRRYSLLTFTWIEIFHDYSLLTILLITK